MGNKRQILKDRTELMEIPELRVRLAPYYRKSGKSDGKIGLFTIAKKVIVSAHSLSEIVRGVYPSKPRFLLSEFKQLALSRFLRELEAGVWTYHVGQERYSKGVWSKGEATKPVPIVRKIAITGGVPKIQQHVSQEVKKMPSFGDVFTGGARPTLPKHLLGGKRG